MPSNSDKWIRSIKDNTAGKVVAEPEGNRWVWQSDEETSHLLKKLDNNELSIEATDIHPTPNSTARRGRNQNRPLKPGGRDSAGGFNPYDHAGKKRR